MIGILPKSIEINGKEEPIRTDFRDILVIFSAFNDEELSPQEKYMVCLTIFYKNFQNMNEDNYEEAYAKAIDFLTLGIKDKDNDTPKLMDWEQDEALVFSAVNKVAGVEVRALDYVHWWTFMGYYTAISDSLFSEVVNIRAKRQKGKKLEANELDFYRKNKDMVDLKIRYTREEIKEREEIKKMLGIE